jgi:hypothetical protein
MADLNVFAGLADALTGLRGTGTAGPQAEAAANALHMQAFGSGGGMAPDMNAIIAAANRAAGLNPQGVGAGAGGMMNQGRRKSLRRPAPIGPLSSLGQHQQNAGAGAFMPTPTSGAPFSGRTPMSGINNGGMQQGGGGGGGGAAMNPSLQMALGHIIQQAPQGTPVTPGSAAYAGMAMGGAVSEEGKKKQRLEKNRQAAKECRRKKKEYVKCLEERVKLLQEQNTQLLTDLAEVAKSPATLEQVLAKYDNQPLPPPPQSVEMMGQPTSAITAQLIDGGK